MPRPPTPLHLVPLPQGFSPSRVSPSLKSTALGLGCLGLNPESSMCLLCDSLNLLSLSVPQFLRLESGGNGGTRLSELL